ncbi:hypothetical protein A2631_03005 [Candidatus Daviesbacteria bacterium RIFCSPHIGHO2_01_FULL_44_29]|uniref:Uncharacterized protein n=1 Tax=Candidatus Daviesbacteria bacterium RIFCSPHIGHO2_02_FULL_43_12 TaxID=1797776 RepID=A0A1F5KKA3_9BACT|nr:MAG: hypothetical protein A2631_03005 [Candidatus Daviesbacteria bacterium RIFCSPHIGHO2_01_FULL_44_29]OGE40794.1 MAG: hypothetical protein A3E86_02340 [Candidatus Daviesbacteria bacterium RIFCSPHIGHO2_12_FULL_47_45]OGE41353.1 MAG: hypothetical protein A3D25_02400 [Candidatus Daviesbacteria bacterium RIFCSPHIGHO2_02_FULL_43_12]OGE69554.1 MAG: hypothetical protein A3B55_04145 [Candidatus Daviesbacteria bacterium RIFCSPLOWO2_01_FULL_43_15]
MTRPGFFPTQDFIYIARLYQMDKAVSEGHFPVRWVKDFRYGEPLYNFYAPLSYYIGVAIKHSLFLSYIQTTKIIFGMTFLLSGLAMYLFVKSIFGRYPGFIAAILYMYAPYHSVDIYVRGALSEAWALVFFPLIFWTIYRLSLQPTIRNTALVALSLGGLFYTHNVMTMLFSPFLLAWMGYCFLKNPGRKLGINLALSFVWGIAVAASFLLPAFIEKAFVQSKYLTQGYFDFRGHFVTVPQFFSTFWGYGASVWGNEDGMSFQIGPAHWVLFGLSLLTGFLLIARRKLKGLFKIIFETSKFDSALLTYGFFVATFGLSLFMQHNKSAFVWERFDLLSFTQFPWRFLGLSIFFVSAACSLLVLVFKPRLTVVFVIAIIVATYTFNIGFFRPDSYYYDSIDEHYISIKILSQDDKLPRDYLPIWVKRIKLERFSEPTFSMGEGSISAFIKKTAETSFQTTSTQSATLQVPITYFPGWQLKIDGQRSDLLEPDDVGLIKFNVPSGQHKIQLQFRDTPIRTIANITSLVSLVAVAIFLRRRKNALS